MIPRLGDGNLIEHLRSFLTKLRLENDSPFRGRKLTSTTSPLPFAV